MYAEQRYGGYVQPRHAQWKAAATAPQSGSERAVRPGGVVERAAGSG